MSKCIDICRWGALFAVCLWKIISHDGVYCANGDVLTNNWLVELHNNKGGEKEAREVASETGFTFVAPVNIKLPSILYVPITTVMPLASS